MNIERIPLDQITVGDRLRAIDEDYAQLIAANMAEHGQLTPIEVRALPPSRRVEGTHALVAGAHRMRAMQIAGISDAICTVFDGTDLQAQLREVDENLIRHELTELDRGAFLARRQVIYEQLHPQTRHGGNQDGPSRQFCRHGDVSFADDAAEKMRLSPRTVQRAIALHARLLPDVRSDLAGTWISDNAAQLDALSRLHPDAQRAAARALPRFPGLRTVRELVATVSGPVPSPAPADPLDLQFDAFVRLWRRMPAAVRGRVREFVEGEG